MSLPVLAGQQLFLVTVGQGGRAGDAGAHGQDAALFGGVEGDVAWILRPRTDQAHVADQDVDQLRQFVQFGPAQETPHAGDAWIASGGDARPLAVRADNHAAEFVEAEGPAILADAHGPIEHGAG